MTDYVKKLELLNQYMIYVIDAKVYNIKQWDYFNQFLELGFYVPFSWKEIVSFEKYINR